MMRNINLLLFLHFIKLINRILILLMQDFETQQLGHRPAQIVQRAQLYSKSLQRHVELPKDISKSLVVKSQAQYEKELILYTIKASQYQQQLFSHKQDQDLETRQRFEQKMHEKELKNLQQMKQNYKRRSKLAEDYNKHLVEVGKRYTQGQDNKRNRENEEASKLRKQLLEFYEKEKFRKMKAQMRQISVSSCYSDAVERINNIHRKNQEFSHFSAVNLEKELSKNNKFSQRLSQKQRSLSEQNKQVKFGLSKKEEVYIQNLCILQDKQHHYIQKCGKNEDGYINAWRKIGKNVTEMRKKRGQEAKSKLQKWKDCKQRVDQTKSFIPERCLSLIDKTSKATFRKTMSSFRTTAHSFEQSVTKNKAMIRQRDQKRKDQIMDLHLDLTLRNTSSAKIAEKMHSMRQNAGVVTLEFSE